MIRDCPRPAPSPTPTLPPLGVELVLNDTMFTAGEPFELYAALSNPGAARDVDLYVVLDVFQDYYFYPSWSHYPDEGIDKASLSLPGARVTRHDILAFTWPPNAGSASGIKFWGAMLDPATAELLGEIVYVEWGFM